MFDELTISGMATRDRNPFGERLAEARRHAGMTQGQLAKALNTNQSTIAQAEGVSSGSAYTVQMARALGVSAEWLADGTGDMLATSASQIDAEIRDAAARYRKLSSQALSIAELFDQLPRDLIVRTKVQNKVQTLIVDALDAHDAKVEPKHPPIPAQRKAVKT